MKWLKKWSYLLLLTATGILYLTCVDKWQVYAEPLGQAKGWYDSLRQEILMAAGSAVKEDDAGAALGSDGESPSGAADGNNSEGSSSEDNGNPEGGLPEGSGNSAEGSSEGNGNPEGGAPEGTGNPEGSSPDGKGAEGIGNSADGQPESGAAQPSEEIPGTGTEAVPTGEGTEGLPEGEAPEGSAGGEPGWAEVEYMAVEDDYFSDAVFIGDSRTMGMYEYAGLEDTAAFYASTGLTVYKIFDSEIVPVPGERRKITVEEALQQNSFAKIYLMIGINEMGTGTVETFLVKYQEVVNHLQELQPDAIIYLQGIIRVTTERSNQGDYINNEGIGARNEGIAQMADNERVFYLDVNPLICDETGGMVPEYTFDGVHLKAKYIDIWKEYLKSHAVLLPEQISPDNL